MVTSPGVRRALRTKGLPQRTIYNKIKDAKKKAGNSINNEIALCVVGSLEGIDIQKILEKEERFEEIKELRDALSKFDFSEESTIKRKKHPSKSLAQKEEISPYRIPLLKYDIDPELVKDCKLATPYRNPIKEALLTLETKIRKTLNQPDSVTGIDLIKEAKKAEVFKRTVKSEEDGLYMLYAGAMLWLRNPSGHRKMKYKREDALKIILFTDYLIRLFDDLFNKRF